MPVKVKYKPLFYRLPLIIVQFCWPRPAGEERVELHAFNLTDHGSGRVNITGLINLIIIPPGRKTMVLVVPLKLQVSGRSNSPLLVISKQ